jgi:hypothetical protein
MRLTSDESHDDVSTINPILPRLMLSESPTEDGSTKCRKERECKWLGRNVGFLFGSGNVLHCDAAIRNVFAEVMHLCVNVLGARSDL